ncbi:xanthine dehydrogenase family protein molybdopterin-binding subunit [Amycolatopsis sp. H20-H5]|uniref:xanthine dehydrogenase family protein molybdopterin-binding subunit n=1 Tax=Amycolatopsis sp. H20-H5 TaxID=3046309 RepID=UPI002DB55A38|nr:xanthine dehydrogenase family protein molybdopterin-binding subunit [Amycolatopsis sp. H20-H5]MEC3975761.1 xanthine dehydrogenase family protein molybdopterin-binding subunit [Amycolatopsis sp. H20-H5]
MTGPSIGQPVARVDGVARVTGAARYSADHSAPGLVHAVLVTSAVSRASVAAPDVADARSQPGVVEVFTDFSGARLPWAAGQVNFFGQPVAIVVGTTLEAAEHAARLIDTGPAAGGSTPAVTDMNDPGLPTVVPPRSPDYRRGDPDSAIAAAPVRVDQRYRIARENHNPMEPPGVVAEWTGDRLTMYDKTQWVQGTARDVAAALGVPPENVRVISPFIGGAFGSAGLTWPHQILAAWTARQLRRPVKLVLTRKQMYSSIGYRPASDQRVILAAGRDGRITATAHEARTEDARYASYQDEITAVSRFLYRSPAMRSSHRLVPLDVAVPTYTRGPGFVTGTFALESAMDELAVELGIDPIELRLRNEPDANQDTGLPFSSRGLPTCLRRGAAEFGWAGRNPAPRSRREDGLLIGTGVASGAYNAGRRPASARARIDRAGNAVVSSATSDMGPGTATSMTQVAADALGLPMSRVQFMLGDSELPTAPMHAGSVTMASVGPAVLTACTMLRDALVRIAVTDPASPLYGVPVERVTVRDGRLSSSDDPKRSETYRQLLSRRGGDGLDTLRDWSPSDNQTRYDTHGYGAVFAEVAVDELVGTIRVRRMRAVYDVGAVVNPRLAHSQALSGMVYGIGMALLEGTIRDHRDGRIVNANLSNYLVPVNADIVDLDASFLGEADPVTGPLGVKGLAELVIVGVPAAVANAVYHATGRRARELPITLESQL